MKEIKADDIAAAVRDLFLRANIEADPAVREALQSARLREEEKLPLCVLDCLGENLTVAAETGLPICQDTGMAVVFADIGVDVHLTGGCLQEAVDRGVHAAYLDGQMRCSIVRDPLYHRENTGDNTPALLHIRQVPGDTLRLTVAPKGFGSENMSRIRMFTPAATENDIVAFVTDTVRSAGANPCPPIVVGVGLGSDFEGVAILAKRALVRPLGEPHRETEYATLENRILEEINCLGIGPQGFGGRTTALAVHLETAPTHIAGLPCAVNICCHVYRHATCIL